MIITYVGVAEERIFGDVAIPREVLSQPVYPIPPFVTVNIAAYYRELDGISPNSVCAPIVENDYTVF